jgi:hypothetical protein
MGADWGVEWQVDPEEQRQLQDFTGELAAWRGFGQALDATDLAGGGYVLLWRRLSQEERREWDAPELCDEIGAAPEMVAIARAGGDLCWFFADRCRAGRGIWKGTTRTALCPNHWRLVSDWFGREENPATRPGPRDEWNLRWQVDSGSRTRAESFGDDGTSARRVFELIAPDVRVDEGGYIWLFPPEVNAAVSSAIEYSAQLESPSPERGSGVSLCSVCFAPCDDGKGTYVGRTRRLLCDWHWDLLEKIKMWEY